MRAIAQPDNATPDLRSFLLDNSELNIMRQCSESIRAVSSWVERYAAFCDPLSIPYFPPRPDIVRQWGSFFGPGVCAWGGGIGGHFPLHVARVRKTCQIRDIPTDRHNASIRAIANGRTHAQDLSNRCDNLTLRDTFALFAKRVPFSSEFWRVALSRVCFYFAVQYEGLTTRRALVADDLHPCATVKHKSLMGIRSFDGNLRLPLKLKVRGDRRYGTIEIRPCFCTGAVLADSCFCSVCHFWPAVSRRADPGDFIPPTSPR